MFLATINKGKQLLYLNYIGRVSVGELRRAREEAAPLLSDLAPGFRVLADFDRLESMDTDCAQEIGRMMEMVEEKGVGLVVRVISDPSKDIGMNILAKFHYKQPPQALNCETMEQAAKALEL